jgi:hypothetical protein
VDIQMCRAGTAVVAINICILALLILLSSILPRLHSIDLVGTVNIHPSLISSRK